MMFITLDMSLELAYPTSPTISRIGCTDLFPTEHNYIYLFASILSTWVDEQAADIDTAKSTLA